MVENMKPHDCIEIYNRLTARLGEAIPVTDASLERAAWFLDWCDKKWINPKHWIVARHEANGWAYQVDFQDLAHPSEEFMERWQTWGRIAWHRWIKSAQIANASSKTPIASRGSR